MDLSTNNYVRMDAVTSLSYLESSDVFDVDNVDSTKIEEMGVDEHVSSTENQLINESIESKIELVKEKYEAEFMRLL